MKLKGQLQQIDPAEYKKLSCAATNRKYKLLSHQINAIRDVANIVDSWKTKPKHHRGFLLYHHVGAGKTSEMTGIILSCTQIDPELQIVVLASKIQVTNLRQDFQTEFDRFFTSYAKTNNISLRAFRTERAPPMRRRWPGSERVVRAYNSEADVVWFPELGTLPDKSPRVCMMPIYRMGNDVRLIQEKEHSRKMPPVDFSGRVLFLFDEAHNLFSPPPGNIGAVKAVDLYGRIFEFLTSRSMCDSSLLVSLTGTPVVNVSDFKPLAKLVAPYEDHAAIDRLNIRSEKDFLTLSSFFNDRVDCWQLLGNHAVYPRVEFEGLAMEDNLSLPLRTLADAKNYIEANASRFTDTTLLGKAAISDKVVQRHANYLMSFNPQFDQLGKQSIRTPSQITGRSERLLWQNMKKYSRERLNEFCPKLCKLLTALRENRGKVLVACRKTHGYNIGTAIGAALRDLGGFTMFNMEPILTEFRRQYRAKQLDLDRLIKTGREELQKKKGRQFMTTAQISQAARLLSSEKEKLLFLDMSWQIFVKKATSSGAGLFNDPANNDGSMLEVVVAERTIFFEGVDMTVLRNIHVFDVVPINVLSQIIGRSQRACAFASVEDKADHVVRVSLYVTAWPAAASLQLQTQYQKMIDNPQTQDHVEPFLKMSADLYTVWKKLLRLSQNTKMYPAKRAEATRLLQKLQRMVISRATKKKAGPMLKLEGIKVNRLVEAERMLGIVKDFSLIQKFYNMLMSTAVNCQVAERAHKEMGMFPAAVSAKDVGCRNPGSKTSMDIRLLKTTLALRDEKLSEFMRKFSSEVLFKELHKIGQNIKNEQQEKQFDLLRQEILQLING